MRAALDSLQSRHALSAAYTDDLDSSDYILSLQAVEGLLLVAPIDQVITGELVVKGNGRYWRCKDCAVMTSCSYGNVLYQSKMKGILQQKNFYRLNLIFWIVMGCGIARFGRRGLKTTET